MTKEDTVSDLSPKPINPGGSCAKKGSQGFGSSPSVSSRGQLTLNPAIMPIAKCGAPVSASGTKQMAM